jgi:HSP20 family protein
LSEKWWRRKRNSQWDEFFEEFDKLEKMVDDMMQDIFEETPPEQEKKKHSNPYVFGFSVSMGSDGKPQVQKFGTLQPSLQGSEIREEREPLIDIMETKDEVEIIAELPGVEKDGIKLDLTESALTISVDTTERKYYKKLLLPAKVREDSIQTNYKNGVLEVRVKKVGGKSIKVKEHSFTDH